VKLWDGGGLRAYAGSSWENCCPQDIDAQTPRGQEAGGLSKGGADCPVCRERRMLAA